MIPSEAMIALNREAVVLLCNDQDAQEIGSVSYEG